MPRSRKYRDKIVIEREIGDTDETGRPLGGDAGYETHAVRMAAVAAGTGGESSADGQTRATVIYTVTLRADSGTRQIDATMRVRLPSGASLGLPDGAIFGITAVRPVGDSRRELVLDCVWEDDT
ncbi:MAG: head-tail adaptor protein [Planctomycetota bacterium]